MHVRGIFGDFAKAFHCMNHEILLAKLYFYGIRRPSEDWFRFYLTKRRQKVEVKSRNRPQNCFPVWGILKHGVPKGLSLGPVRCS